MTREEAIVKVKKIVAHAKGNTNDNERQVAMNQAKKLMEQHNLKAEDIDNHAYLVAYDEISKEVIEFTNKHPIVDMGFFRGFDAVGEILRQSKDSIPDAYKVSLIKKIKGHRTVVLLLLGKKYEPLLDRLDTILKNHNL